jgi:hypothetical protein
MRRLLAMTVLAGAAFALPVPAHAEYPCDATNYGVDAGNTHIGICAGGVCQDLCWIEFDPYCYQDTRQAIDACAIWNKL